MAATTRNSKTELKVGKKKFILPRDNYGYRDCPACNGKGSNLRYPYYATIMPEKREIPCETCGGTGTIFVVPNNASIVRKSKLNGKVKENIIF
jgi:DnaJ-class molecular chaperone